MSKRRSLLTCAGFLVAVGCVSVRGMQAERYEGNSGEPALVVAVSRGNLTEVSLLLESGADPNARGLHGWPPLLTAIFTGHSEAVPALLDAGARIDAADDDGMTP